MAVATGPGVAAPAPERAAPRRRGTATGVRLAALAVVGAVSVAAHFHRLGAATALLDELTYQQSGLAAVRGTYTTHASPYLARHLFGLAQEVLGEGLLAARVVSASASVLTGVVLLLFARRLAGWWAGVGALALWSVLPQSTHAPDGSVTMLKLGRSALLEPVTALFVALGLYLGWRWLTTGRTPAAVLAGVALGAGVAAKPTAALVLPVVAGAGWLALRHTGRAGWQVVALAAGAVAAVALSYAPLGPEAPAAVAELVRYQAGEHAADGHAVIVAGDVHDRAPWWAHAWWQWRSVGTPAAVALASTVLAALVLARPRAAVAYLTSAIAVPALYLSFLAGFGLSHYLHVWQPALVLLAVLGLTALVRRGGRGRAAAVALAAVLAVVGAQTMAALAATEPRGYGALPGVLAGHDLGRSTVVVVGQTLVTAEYLPGAELVLSPAHATRPIVAVVVDPGTARRAPRPEVDDYLEAQGGRLQRVPVDHLVVHVRPPATGRGAGG